MSWQARHAEVSAGASLCQSLQAFDLSQTNLILAVPTGSNTHLCSMEPPQFHQAEAQDVRVQPHVSQRLAPVAHCTLRTLTRLKQWSGSLTCYTRYKLVCDCTIPVLLM